MLLFFFKQFYVIEKYNLILITRYIVCNIKNMQNGSIFKISQIKDGKMSYLAMLKKAQQKEMQL